MTAANQIIGRTLSRLLRLPPHTTDHEVHHRVRVPMRDGVELVADHYRPLTSNPAGTLLVRGPYGRRYPVSVLFGAVYASRGYHVVVQSVRGTFGSGGDFDPFRHEIADGADTAAWLREQPWFTGSFAHDRDVLPRLHPVGVADRSAAGNGGRGHHRRPA